ncbi:uncharacterized protein CMC5_036330 [Chondromyces crocatus]|uniref:Uncharacterized protein n=1 Tax=Chondromyces crocatus TaxID=52 RepID=A0A0K1EF42_CHOCO|nr:uncharacterized protein CMC5_036330 [Chondromyces crocatus]
MSEENQNPAKRTGMQSGDTARHAPPGRPSTTSSEEVGQGPGLDPPSPPAEPEEEEDEAFHDRPTRPGLSDDDEL